MAKKKAAKKKTAKPKGKVRRKAPESANQPLPGMEQVRDRKLEGYCEGIADGLHRKNEAVADVDGYRQGALQHMQETNKHSFKWAGVVLTRIPGTDKLAVRTTNDTEATNVDAGDQE